MKQRSFQRTMQLGLPVALLAASSLAVTAFANVTVQEGAATATKEAVQEVAKKVEGQSDKGVSKEAIGRGRLSGKTPPPAAKPVPVSRSIPAVKAPAAGGVTQGAGALKEQGAKLPGVGQPATMTPEQIAKQKEYLAKNPNGANAGKVRGAVPRPPRNPNAKLDIEFGTDKHDFGKARQGDQLTHVFEMKSGGSEPLVISQASPTCGCTLGEIKVKNPGDEMAILYKFGDPIQPGADVELEATLDTTSKTHKTNVRINVYSNDATAGQNQLQLVADVEPFIVATPKFLQLGEIREGVSKTATVDFRTSNREAIALSQDVTRPIPLPQGLSMELAPLNPNEEGKSSHWRATFTIADDSTAEPKGYMLRLNSDVPLPKSGKTAKAVKPGAPAVYQVSTNINYRILGALSLQPQYVSLGLVRPDQPVVRNVRLTCHEEGFDLSSVTVQVVGEGDKELQWADRFVASVKPVSGANAVDIELRLLGLPDDADGSFRGRVNIKTGHPSNPEEFFRFSGVCRKLSGQAPAPKGVVPPVRPGQATPAKGAQPVKKPAAGGGQ